MLQQLSVVSIGNSIQSYLTLHYTRRMYNGLFVPNKSLFASSSSASKSSSDPEDSVSKLSPVLASSGAAGAKDQVTPLAGRLFGTYTLVISVVRLYVAYNIASRPMYHLGIMTYVVAWAHFVSELAVFRTQRLGKPQLLPLGFATMGILWMVMQYGFYVEA